MQVSHNPYFNRWFSAMMVDVLDYSLENEVTILILIDGFLQSVRANPIIRDINSHNPYFNRWFSAIFH